MKQTRMLLFSFCLLVGMGHALSVSSAPPSALDDLAAKLQDQLKRAGNSIYNRYEKVRDRVVAKMSSFNESIAKEEISEKVDVRLCITQDDIQAQFDHFRVQLGSVVPDVKIRARLEKQLGALQKKVTNKVASLAGNVKTQSSKALQDISKKASRLSDQVASMFDVNKEVIKKKEEVASNEEDLSSDGSQEEEIIIPVAGNGSEIPEEEISVS